MQIVLTGAHKGGDHPIDHDLNFQSERYEATHTVVGRAQTTPWTSMR
jgi:transcription initiation factor IIF auxiliary subunit